jgi:dTDP-4-amino-4,6-dideoxygalactose transaminase
VNGPERVEPRLIGVFGSVTGDEELAALEPSIRAGWMGMGPRVREFEAEFSSRLGQPFAMADSGSNALQLAVTALGLPSASEVIIPSFTWIACAHAVVLSGHRPVFVDVELETANIDSSSVERALNSRTGAIMVVHYAGKPVDVQAIADFGLPVVEDAAHAVDSSVRGRRCGTVGDVGVFSFDSVKNLATPDGGGVSGDEELVGRVRRLRYCGVGSSGFDRSMEGGRWWEHREIEIFPRAIPNDVSASIALAQLRRLSESQARRREIWASYHAAFADLTWLASPPGPAEGERHSYFTYLVRVLDGRRDALAHHLLGLGIYTTLRYQPLHLVYGTRPRLRLANAERLSEEGLNLPLHPRLTEEDVDRVIEGVRSLR